MKRSLRPWNAFKNVERVPHISTSLSDGPQATSSNESQIVWPESMTAFRNSSDPGQSRNVKDERRLKLRAYTSSFPAFSSETALGDKVSKAGNIISNWPADSFKTWLAKKLPESSYSSKSSSDQLTKSSRSFLRCFELFFKARLSASNSCDSCRPVYEMSRRERNAERSMVFSPSVLMGHAPLVIRDMDSIELCLFFI